MIVSDVMVRNVFTVRSDAPLSAAVDLMVEHGISGVPVLDELDCLVGVITEGDLMRRSEIGTEWRKASWWREFIAGTGRIATDYVRTHSRRVSDLMTYDVETVEPGASVADVVAIMERRHVKRVPVVEDSKLVGLVSRHDLVSALARAMHKRDTTAPADAAPADATAGAEQAGATASDAEIRTRLETELRKQRWFMAGVDVRVTDGIVVLDGIIADERARDALRVAAENVPGVKAVEEQLIWVGPGGTAGMPII